MTPIGRGNQNSQGPYGYQLTQGETDPPDTIIQSMFAASTSTKALEKKLETISEIFHKQIELAVGRRGGVKKEISRELGLSSEDLISSLLNKNKKQKSVQEDDFPKLEGLVSQALSPKELELSLEDLELLIKNQKKRKREDFKAITQIFRKQIELAVGRRGGVKKEISRELGLSSEDLISSLLNKNKKQKSVQEDDFPKLEGLVSQALSPKELELSLEDLELLIKNQKKRKREDFKAITQIFRKQIELAVERRGGVKTEISNKLGLSNEDLISSLVNKRKQKSVHEDDFPKLEGLVSQALSPKELELSLEDLESLIKNQNHKKRKRIGGGRGKGSKTITELFRKQIVVAVARTDGNKLSISGALNLSHRKLLYYIIEGSVAKGRHQESVKQTDFSKLDEFVSRRLSTEERKLSLEELDRLLEECQAGQRKIEPLVPFRDPSEFPVSSLVGVDHQPKESSFNSFKETANPIDELTLALLPSTPEESAAAQEERREPTYNDNDSYSFNHGGGFFNSNPGVLPVGSSFNSFKETANPIDELTLALLPSTPEESAAVQEERREPTYNDPHFLDYGGGGFNSNPAVLPVGSSDSPFEGMPGSFALELALSERDPN